MFLKVLRWHVLITIWVWNKLCNWYYIILSIYVWTYFPTLRNFSSKWCVTRYDPPSQSWLVGHGSWPTLAYQEVGRSALMFPEGEVKSACFLFLASVVSPVLYSRLMFCKFYNCGKCHQGWFMTKFFLHLKFKWKGMLNIHVFNSYNFLFIF